MSDDDTRQPDDPMWKAHVGQKPLTKKPGMPYVAADSQMGARPLTAKPLPTPSNAQNTVPTAPPPPKKG